MGWLINENYLMSVRTINLLNELFETLKITENCTICKDNTRKLNLDGLSKSINKIENLLAESEKEMQINEKEA